MAAKLGVAETQVEVQEVLVELQAQASGTGKSIGGYERLRRLWWLRWTGRWC